MAQRNDDRVKFSLYVASTVVATILVVILPSESTLRTLAIGFLGSFSVVLITEGAVHMPAIRLFLSSKVRYRNSNIRVSIAYLIRIKLEDQYLLILSHRFQHFQPVGGAFKRFELGADVFQKLGVHDDDKLPIDDETRGDLRVRVPGRHLVEFLKWYRSGTNREIGPWREFYCEMVESHLLPIAQFRFLIFRWIRRHEIGIQFSTHFGCYEYKIAEVYEPSLTAEQKLLLRQAVDAFPNKLRLATDDEIRKRGSTKEKPKASIAETAEWLLD
jgi:hypothetical protein